MSVYLFGSDFMPRKKSGLFDNKAYQNEYHKNMKTKLISFNPNNESDMELWEILNQKGKGNVSPFIKELIREAVPPKVYAPTRYSDTLYGCGSCGHELAPGRPKFCHECGKPVD